MKKLFKAAAAAVILTTAVSASAFAERFLEFGMDVFAGFDENLMGATDIFVEDLVIDLPEIADSLGSDGFLINGRFSPDFFMNVNIGVVKGGISAGLTGRGNLGISKELFEFLAYGNELDEEVTTTLKAGMQLYAETALTARFKVKDFSVKVTPSVYVPLIYVPNPNATVTTSFASDGTINASASADFTVYSIMDLSSAFSTDEEGNMSFDSNALSEELSSSEFASVMASSGGFDIGGEVTLPFIFNLTLGGYAHIPLVPGHLKYSTSGNVTVSGNVDKILNSVTAAASGSGSGDDEEASEDESEEDDSEEEESASSFYTVDGPNFSGLVFESANYSVNRPMRFGAMAEWRPFGNWCVISGQFGFAADNPFSADFVFKDNCYVEYKLGVDANLIGILGANFTTEYTEKIFAHTLGLRVNLRIIEIDANVGVSSSSFVKSFQGSGFTGKVGFRMGF